MKFLEKVNGLYIKAVARFGLRYLIVVIASLALAVLAASLISVGTHTHVKYDEKPQQQAPHFQQKELSWEPRNYFWQAPKDPEAVHFFDIMTPPNIYEKNGTIIYEKCDQDLIVGTFPLTL